MEDHTSALEREDNAGLNPSINASPGARNLLRFILPSLAGIALFLVPITVNGDVTLLVNLIIKATKTAMGSMLLPFVLVVLGFSALCSTVGFVKKDFFKGYWAGLFNVGPINLAIRICSFLLGIIIFFQLGPEFIWSKNTGGMMLNDVVANLIPFFLWAGMLMPLLTEFGLMEFIGNLLMPIMRPIFKLPGCSAVNCAVAWVGSGTMGIVLTNKIYEDGYYTRREAVAIATGYAIPSIAIVFLLTSFLHMSPYFPTIYLTVIGVALTINIILARIPPIAGFSANYAPDAPHRDMSELTPAGQSKLGYALKTAAERGGEKKENIVKSGLKITGDIWFTLEPIVLFIGTIGTIVVEYTDIVKYLALPLEGLLSVLGLPEAPLAGQSILLGGVDVFLPFVVGSGIESELTKFVISVVCSMQIIFLTETGPLLLKLKLGLKFWHLLALFLLRTVMGILLATPVAYMLFG